MIIIIIIHCVVQDKKRRLQHIYNNSDTKGTKDRRKIYTYCKKFDII